ncbi:UDP-2,4-diacetamido-2,4,6-trideoxy-beta-L-altropyranose hydrolase [Halobacillus sp. A5]|uniref:UDP-2,4-diacetamido-2,4, 6-trideoxy-beta-L-altropyranose hydrolase n=1 Tax=Halobacillus sp. A5 TaxID=2880263 RepID=UPI002111957F|nr:UDP-2,4-diacetamido-2,4,6-trideoxy-beta-L-altropyranose hydrolase [Halobacillus sp. A5]MCP3028397.1 UDP-2,4-diacetamido-2,4,6-trideoxy-beta-L-altropyranose hydrolase [Halobacillus sp. A5]
MRTDASIEIGSGHVMRCLTLAHQLRKAGAHVSFICRLLKGNMIQYIKDQQFPVYPLPFPVEEHFNKDPSIPYSSWLEVDYKADLRHTAAVLQAHHRDVDWFLVDHYALGKKWEQGMREFSKRLIVIDDLADREHECDLLVDQNLYKNYLTRYDHLVPEQTIKLLGPDHMIVREEFIRAKAMAERRSGNVKRLLISFGGTDPTNETIKALAALKQLNLAEIRVDIVAGASNPRIDEIKHICLTNPSYHFHCQINYMADLMRKADLALGAGGTSTWERCMLGLPALTIQTASNQADILSLMEEKGAVVCLGTSEDVTANDIAQGVSFFLGNEAQLRKMSEAAERVGGKIKGGSVVRHMLEGASGMVNVREFELKKLSEKELPVVLRWRNSEAIREAMYTDHTITMEEHKQWFDRVNNDAATNVQLLYYKKQPIGLVNFSKIDRHHNKCFWGFYIGEQSAPGGSGTVLGLLALAFIFEQQNMYKVCAEVLVTNQKSLQYHKKLGFVEEGRFMNHTIKNGQYVDVIPMAHFKDTWFEAKKRIIKSLGGGEHEQLSSS